MFFYRKIKHIKYVLNNYELHYHRKCDFQLYKRKLGYRTLLPLTAPIARKLPKVYCGEKTH